MKSYMWTVKDVANLFGVSIWCVYDWTDKGFLTNDNDGRRYLFNPSQLKRFIIKHKSDHPYTNKEMLDKLTGDYTEEIGVTCYDSIFTVKELVANEVRNSEHYTDPTPYKAIKNVEKKSYPPEVGKLMKTIFYICGLAGYDVKGRVTLVDRKTGKEYN